MTDEETILWMDMYRRLVIDSRGLVREIDTPKGAEARAEAKKAERHYYGSALGLHTWEPDRALIEAKDEGAAYAADLMIRRLRNSSARTSGAAKADRASQILSAARALSELLNEEG